MNDDLLREVLRKYIRHVRQCEGTDFIDAIGAPMSGSDVHFSDAELAELKRLSEDARQ